MLKIFSRESWIVVPVAVLLVVSACAGRERVRNVEGGPVATGPGTLESVRKQLEGTWNLALAEIVAADGTRRVVKASALMTYDAYGAFSIKGAFEDPAVGSAQTAALNFAGRAAIDVQKRELHLLDVQQSESDFAKLPPEIAAARVRSYEFTGEQLTMTVKDAQGRVTAMNTWRRTR